MTYAIIILACAVLMILIEEMLIRRRGDCHLFFDTDKAENHRIYQDEGVIELSFSLPMKNTGPQQGLLIDCTARLSPEGDTFRDFDLQGRVLNNESIRRDDYWEANIIKSEKQCMITVLLTVRTRKRQEMVKALLENFILDIHYKYYGRSLMAYRKCSIKCRLSAFTPVSGPFFGDEPEPVKAAVPDTSGRIAIPIKTHLLRPDDDMTDIIKRYTAGIAEKGDIFTIAESAVAIMQGRVYYVEDINPRFLARRINRYFLKDSSLSSPYSLEMGFREVGVLRIVIATIIGIAGKLIGRSGDFYRIVGKGVATIDDCTGTLPPYDKCVVMGPADIHGLVESIKKNTGLEAAIVDVNDLKRVDILASTCPQHASYLQEALLNNPAGNANEQTPIVLVKAPGK